MENARKKRDIKLITTTTTTTTTTKDTTWCQNQTIILQSFSQKKLLVIEIIKPQILMNKPVSLGLSI